MHKKWVGWILAGMMAVTVMTPFAAAQEVAPVSQTTQEQAWVDDSCLYYGTVTAIGKAEDGTLLWLDMTSGRYGEYRMLLSEQTVWVDSGNYTADDPSDLAVGESMYVFHSGVSTMSLPPQSPALAVLRNLPMDTGCGQYHAVEAVSIEEGKGRITTDGGGLYLQVDEKTRISSYAGQTLSLADLKADDRIIAWYEGVQESYPAQTYAHHVLVLPGQEQETLTRAQLAAMLCEKAGSPVVNSTLQYSDVDPADPYAEAIRWADGQEYMNGFGDGRFGPEEAVTREQMATVLYRYGQDQGQGFIGAWAFHLEFTDADQISDYAYEAVCYLTMHQIFPAEEDRFMPQGTVTREQARQILDSFWQSLED